MCVCASYQAVTALHVAALRRCGFEDSETAGYRAGIGLVDESLPRTQRAGMVKFKKGCSQ